MLVMFVQHEIFISNRLTIMITLFVYVPRK